MKKLIYSTAFLYLLCSYQLTAYTTNSALLQSQDIILIGGQDFSPRFNCTNSINVGIQVANLNQVIFGKNNYNYVLPSGAPDMYVKFEMGTISETQQVSVFNPTGTLTCLIGGSYDLFKANLSFTFNSNEVCFAKGSGGAVNYTVSIITYDQYGSEIPYPICDYSNSNDIFSCAVFTATAPFCNTRSICNSGNINSASSNAGVDCNGGTCGALLKNGGNQHDSNHHYISESKLRVNPNPFNDELTIQFAIAEEDIIKGIQLIDINGRTLRTIDIRQLTQNTQLTINTSELQSGVYFISLQTDRKLINNRLIKQ